MKTLSRVKTLREAASSIAKHVTSKRERNIAQQFMCEPC